MIWSLSISLGLYPCSLSHQIIPPHFKHPHVVPTCSIHIISLSFSLYSYLSLTLWWTVRNNYIWLYDTCIPIYICVRNCTILATYSAFWHFLFHSILPFKCQSWLCFCWTRISWTTSRHPFQPDKHCVGTLWSLHSDHSLTPLGMSLSASKCQLKRHLFLEASHHPEPHGAICFTPMVFCVPRHYYCGTLCLVMIFLTFSSTKL